MILNTIEKKRIQNKAQKKALFWACLLVVCGVICTVVVLLGLAPVARLFRLTLSPVIQYTIVFFRTRLTQRLNLARLGSNCLVSLSIVLYPVLCIQVRQKFRLVYTLPGA